MNQDNAHLIRLVECLNTIGPKVLTKPPKAELKNDLVVFGILSAGYGEEIINTIAGQRKMPAIVIYQEYTEYNYPEGPDYTDVEEIEFFNLYHTFNAAAFMVGRQAAIEVSLLLDSDAGVEADWAEYLLADR